MTLRGRSEHGGSALVSRGQVPDVPRLFFFFFLYSPPNSSFSRSMSRIASICCVGYDHTWRTRLPPPTPHLDPHNPSSRRASRQTTTELQIVPSAEVGSPLPCQMCQTLILRIRIRCDCLHPCSNCSSRGLGSSCFYPNLTTSTAASPTAQGVTHKNGLAMVYQS